MKSMLRNLTVEGCSDSPKKVPMQGLDWLEIFVVFINQKIVIKAKNHIYLLRNVQNGNCVILKTLRKMLKLMKRAFHF